MFQIQVLIHAIKGTGNEGYVALDDVEFLKDFQDDNCPFGPDEAKPETPTTTAEPPPTEPPNGKICN